MKTTLIAAAAMLPLAALAQSSVAVYGMLDSSLVHYRFNETPTRASSRLSAVANDASRLGFRGSEDLGGGLRGYFKLEHGLQVDTGTQTDANAFWSREAYAGLGSKQLGSVQLGSQYTPNLWMSTKTDPFTRFGVGGQPTLAQGARGYTLLFNNAVHYISPTWAGSTARLMVAAGEGAATGKSVAASVDYAGGPLYLGLVVEEIKVTAASVGLAGAPLDSRTISLGAAYDFGAVKLQGHAQTNRTERVADVRVFIAALTVPAGNGHEVRVSYGHRTGANDTGASLAAIGYMHALSKRTSLLVNAARLTNERSASTRMGPARGEQAALGLPGAGQDTSGLQLGVRHWF